MRPRGLSPRIARPGLRVHLLRAQNLQGTDLPHAQQLARQIEVDLRGRRTRLGGQELLAIDLNGLQHIGDVLECGDNAAAVERRCALKPGLGCALLLLRGHAVKQRHCSAPEHRPK